MTNPPYNTLLFPSSNANIIAPINATTINTFEITDNFFFNFSFSFEILYKLLVFSNRKRILYIITIEINNAKGMYKSHLRITLNSPATNKKINDRVFTKEKNPEKQSKFIVLLVISFFSFFISLKNVLFKAKQIKETITQPTIP